MKQSNSFKKAFPQAFSLIELLSVIAIISLMMTIGASVFGSLRGSGNMNSAVFGISLLLEQARSHAQANNVHVWVGFREDGDTLMVASVAGVTGSSADIQSSNTLSALMKPKRFEKIEIGSASGFDGMASGAEEIEVSNDMQFTVGAHGTSGVTYDRVINFAPNGEAKADSQSTSRWIQVSLKPTTANLANDAAIQVSGLTGQVRVFRR